MKYTIELTDTEYNILTGFMNMISSEIQAYYFQKAELEPVKTMRIEDTTEYKMGYEAGKQNGYACCRNNTELAKEVKEAEYNKALEDANHAMNVLENMTETEREEWFEGCADINEVVCTFTVQRIIGTTKIYEQKKKAEEFRVGDEVNNEFLTKTLIVSNILDDSHFDGVDFNGVLYISRNSKSWYKTGRHFDEIGTHFEEISQLFSKLRGEENEENN